MLSRGPSKGDLSDTQQMASAGANSKENGPPPLAQSGGHPKPRQKWKRVSGRGLATGAIAIAASGGGGSSRNETPVYAEDFDDYEEDVRRSLVAQCSHTHHSHHPPTHSFI